MTADLTILPVGGGAHLGTLLADVLKEIRRRGIVYQLTGTTTCLEGTWEQIMDIARLSHEIGRRHAPHIVTMLRIEDDIEGSDGLIANVAAVEKIAGEEFNHEAPASHPPFKVISPPAAQSPL
jgi:uncharacterized protein YqgV (UPF0045/DUF77 family)